VRKLVVKEGTMRKFVVVIAAAVLCGTVAAASQASTPASKGSAAAGGQDQSRIVWSRVPASQDRQQIVSAEPDGSDLIQLSHPKRKFFDIDAQVSPDGSQVIYDRGTDEDPARGGPPPQFILVGPDGENQQVLDLPCTDPCVFDATPTWTPTAGRIAYTPIVGPFDGPNGSARSGVLQTSALDGSDPLRLSEPGIDGAYEDYSARYSPDGGYVVFTRVRNKPFAVAAFRMDVDGSDVQRLTPWRLQGDLADISPATSGPTKDLVVFETYGTGAPRGKTQNIATVPSTCASLKECRSQLRYLTHLDHGPGARFNPSWSPNGERIAYTKFRGNRHECCVGDIYTMSAAGSHQNPVSTSPLFEYRPDWGVAP